MGPKKRPLTGERKQNPNQAATAKKRTASNATTAPSQPATKKTTTTAAAASSSTANLKAGNSKQLSQTQKTKKSQPVQKDRDKGDSTNIDEKKIKRTSGVQQQQQQDTTKKANELNKGTTVGGKSACKKIDKLDNPSTESNVSDGNQVATLESKHNNVDKKDDKTKALNKMLKNLDIQISGFDNILPKDQHISSISENVKTKSRAAAVRVAACLSSAKPTSTLKRVRADTDKSQQFTTLQKDESKITSDVVNQKESQSTIDAKDLTLESHNQSEDKEICIVETKKKMAAKKYKMELNNQKSKKATQNKVKDEQIEQTSEIPEGKNEESEGTNTGKKKPSKTKLPPKKSEDSKNAEIVTECEQKQQMGDNDPIKPQDNTIEESQSNVNKLTLSPKNVKASPNAEKGIGSNADNCEIEEKDENLKIVLDANTEVVQMDIEEMPLRATQIDAEVTDKLQECEEHLTSETTENTNAKNESTVNQELLAEHDLEKSATPVPVTKQKPTNKFASLQGKASKVSKITNKKQLEVSSPEKTLAEIKAEGTKKDIYDFKSGSEEEENIKMELPVLKDLRELSTEENKLENSEEIKKDIEEIDKTVGKTTDDETEKATTSKNKSAPNRKIKKTLIKKAVLVKVVGKCYKKKTIAIKKALNMAKAKTIIKNKKQKEIVKKVSHNEEDDESDSEDEKKLVIYEQKRYRMASLNALAKVQCLYENESRTAYELGLSKATQMPPKMRNVDVSEDEKDKDNDNKAKDKGKDKDKIKEKKEDKVNDEVEAIEKDKEKEKDKEAENIEDIENKKDLIRNEKNEENKKIEVEIDSQKDIEKKVTTNEDNENAKLVVKEISDDESKVDTKRKFRNIPGGRGVGKHWEMDSDSENDDFERVKLKKKKWQKKVILKKDKVLDKEKIKEKKDASIEKNKKTDEIDKSKEDVNNPVRVKRKYTKRKNIVKPGEKLEEPTAQIDDEKDTKDAEQDQNDIDKKKFKIEGKKPPKKRLKRILKEELIGDYKGILARKRMASLNASAIVAATYEVERHLDKNLEAAYSSYESTDDNEKSLKKLKDIQANKGASKQDAKNEKCETKTNTKTDQNVVSAKDVQATLGTNSRDNKSTAFYNEESNDSKYSKETKETGTDTTTSAGLRDTASVKDTSKEPSRPTSTSVVIVQDTDVTITGVYVNSTTGSSQEAYCKMQYRVQSSVTAEERVLRPSSVEPPKSYTPLSALSSMLPPSASTGLTDVQGSPPPSSTIGIGGNSLSDTLNVGMYPHALELGIHTEPNAPEHGPPPPSYAAAAAAAAAAAYHAHHMHQYQYQQAAAAAAAAVSAGEHVLMNVTAPPPSNHAQSSGGHHYANSQPPPHYGVGSSVMPPPNSPPPTYRACAYPAPPPSTTTMHASGATNRTLSMNAGGGSSAFCPPNMQHHQQQEQHQISHQSHQPQQQHHHHHHQAQSQAVMSQQTMQQQHEQHDGKFYIIIKINLYENEKEIYRLQ